MKHGLKVTGICSLILLLFMSVSDPRGVPSIVLIVPFGLIFIILLFMIQAILGRFSMMRQARLRTSVLIATIPVMLLCLQSLGQLTLRDTLVVVVLFGILYFYTVRLSAQPTSRHPG